MILVCPTVQHTGSKFVVSHILKDFKQLGILETPNGCDSVYFDHLWPHKMNKFNGLLAKYKSLIPIRHPESIVKSWRARGKELDDLFMMLENLEKVVGKYSPLMLPIDCKDRDWWLMQASGMLGTYFSTDWPVVGSCNMEHKLTGSDKKAIDIIFRKHEKFFNRFYNA